MKKVKIFSFLFLFLFTVQYNSLIAQVVINEFSASNLNQYVDNHSDYKY